MGGITALKWSPGIQVRIDLVRRRRGGRIWATRMWDGKHSALYRESKGMNVMDPTRRCWGRMRVRHAMGAPKETPFPRGGTYTRRDSLVLAGHLMSHPVRMIDLKRRRIFGFE